MSLPPSKVIGCDFSGIVERSQSSSFHKGDRIAGVIHGCKDSHTGGFADFLVADPEMCFLVPQGLGLEEACTLGVGWVSATQALQQRLFKEVDEEEKVSSKRNAVSSNSRFVLLVQEIVFLSWVYTSLIITCLALLQLLVYSAATNTGMHVIQQAHLLYPFIYIIAVASTENHSRLQTLGADVCFDYKSPTIEKDVKALEKNVTRAIDCHSEGRSTVMCAQLMGREGRIVRTLPPGMIQGTVPQGLRANEWILSYTALGKV